MLLLYNWFGCFVVVVVVVVGIATFSLFKLLFAISKNDLCYFLQSPSSNEEASDYNQLLFVAVALKRCTWVISMTDFLYCS